MSLIFGFSLVICHLSLVQAQPSRGQPGQPSGASDISTVKRLIAIRREYQQALEQLHTIYEASGDGERRKWVETELRDFHRVPKPAYIIDLDVAGPGMRTDQNVAAANELYRKAMTYKGKGFGSEYAENQIRCELLLQQLLAQYPTSNKCSDAAYYLGDLYETRKPSQYRRAATYFERCAQWSPSTTQDARLRAARIYDRHLSDRAKAIEWYKAVIAHETDDRRRQEAQRRINDLTGA